ncbi:MAG TPA: universal stress protein [Pirellulaceae bacterium]|jgi:nucleotide-binding universal stress UspA family protein|nr:universal stress protein [Pirellulaceae bacterium]
MNWKKILVPTDFSHLSDQAVGIAASLARESGGKLILLHVEEAPVAYGAGEMYYGIAEPDNASLRRMLEEIRLPDGVPVERHLTAGEPAGSIVRFAEENGVDLVVMSTHGRTGLVRLMMGSVAEEVVRRAKCLVLTLKPRSEKAPANQP